MKRLLAVCSLVTLVISTHSVQAGPYVGIEAGGAVPMGDSAEDLELGPTFGGRVGYAIALPLIRVIPEIAFTYTISNYDPLVNESDGETTWTVAAGGRIGIGTGIVPYLFAHIGWGSLSAEGSDWVKDDSGATYDVGAALNLEMLPLANIGIFVSYQHMSHSEINNTALPTSNQWFRFGAQIEMGF